MSDNYDFLHIKRRTAGSSNELSLDVLDHKSAKADEKSSRSSKITRSAKASQGSYRGIGSGSTLAGQDEVEKRKKARRQYRLRLRVIGVLAVVVAAGALVYTGYLINEQQHDYYGRAKALTERLSDVDETLMEIDVLMKNPFNADDEQTRTENIKKMPKILSELNRISVDAQSLSASSPDDEMKAMVIQIDKAARSRTDMAMAAREAFDVSAEASKQVALANRIWGDVVDASQAASEAIVSANKATTPEETSTALDMIRSSASSLESSYEELSNLAATHHVNLDDQKAYLEKKIEALDNAAATSEALLAKNREEAERANEAYNSADAEAAQLAADLPPSVGDIIQECFAERMSSIVKSYEKARERTVKSDSMIRERLAARR